MASGTQGVYDAPMRTTPLFLASLSVLGLVACATGNHADTKAITLSWDLTNERTDDTGKTSNDVSLVLSNDDGSERDRVLLGTFDGCTQQEAPADGPILTLKCWFAGGGDDFQVRFEGTNTLVVDHRIVDEQVEIPAFEPMTTVEVPVGVMIGAKAS